MPPPCWALWGPPSPWPATSWRSVQQDKPGTQPAHPSPRSQPAAVGVLSQRSLTAIELVCPQRTSAPGSSVHQYVAWPHAAAADLCVTCRVAAARTTPK